ncbi:hypothetical protein RhiirA1_465486 [Rhizophagus irregularis]|uniref:Uncharacterized protein n=1 Tax=Rhizophagus irregularis TaxID=588596 RepID=A0A2I1FHQ8_9GLOM|nr:hypothetical protein RhiirA1_465486 [Rhizophagus irregularis]PKY33878.1 hypothetical protein RhiirB3_453147 [Rhizophagus irregularis]
MNLYKSRKQFEQILEYVSGYNELFHYNVTELLGSFIQDGFLKDLFNKNPSQPVDKGQLLIRKFGEAANPKNFTLQAQYYMMFGDMGEIAIDDSVTDDGIYESSEDGLDEDEIH